MSEREIKRLQRWACWGDDLEPEETPIANWDDRMNWCNAGDVSRLESDLAEALELLRRIYRTSLRPIDDGSSSSRYDEDEHAQSMLEVLALLARIEEREA